MKDWAVTIGIVLVACAAVWFWRGAVDKAACDKRVAAVIDSLQSVPTVVTLHDTVYVSQGHVWTPALPPVPNGEGQTPPEAVKDTLGLPVVADTRIILRDDSVNVNFWLSSSFDRRTLLFTHEFKGVTVSYPREVHFVDRIEYRGPSFWEKPVLVLATVGAAVCIQREEWAGAACFGAVGITVLTIDF
jgi:hypothetical protein